MSELQQSPAPWPVRLVAVLGAMAAFVVAGVLLVGHEQPDPADQVRVEGVSSDADRAGATGFTAGELPHAGLLPEHTDAMRTAIESARVGRPERHDVPPPDAFGTTSPCAQRNRLLPRDLHPVVFESTGSPCRVARGTLDDPYVGDTERYRDEERDAVSIDRIVSSVYAWQHGAASWTAAQRRAFDRDASNLVVADARVVRAKAGRGPAEWLPPNVALRCAYAARFAEVVATYDLTLDPADQEVARRQCARA